MRFDEQFNVCGRNSSISVDFSPSKACTPVYAFNYRSLTTQRRYKHSQRFGNETPKIVHRKRFLIAQNRYDANALRREEKRRKLFPPHPTRATSARRVFRTYIRNTSAKEIHRRLTLRPRRLRPHVDDTSVARSSILTFTNNE